MAYIVCYNRIFANKKHFTLYIRLSDGKPPNICYSLFAKRWDPLTKADFKYRIGKIADLADTPTFLEKEAYASLRPF